jgi:2-haloacid dehalogenase
MPNRRSFLLAAGATTAAMSLSAKPELTNVKALVFDTFGTVVDWRGSIIAEGTSWGKAKGLTINWADFADRWRLKYAPAMDKVRKGDLPWTILDDLHRIMLEDVLKEFNIELTDAEKVSWTHVWRRLQPWPDAVAGLTRLKKKFIIAPLSNGNIALMTTLAKFGGLPWDVILGAELARHYKPDREVYVSAYRLLDLKPEQVMMCAAHSRDLQAARTYGLRTGFIHQPNEFGGGSAGKPDQAKTGDFDVVAENFLDLATQLGA